MKCRELLFLIRCALSWQQLDDNHARAYGMQVAEKIIAAALEYFPGVYLITPFLHYEATTELAKFARSL